jgi:hypothetical protein
MAYLGPITSSSLFISLAKGINPWLRTLKNQLGCLINIMVDHAGFAVGTADPVAGGQEKQEREPRPFHCRISDMLSSPDSLFGLTFSERGEIDLGLPANPECQIQPEPGAVSLTAIL